MSSRKRLVQKPSPEIYKNSDNLLMLVFSFLLSEIETKKTVSLFSTSDIVFTPHQINQIFLPAQPAKPKTRRIFGSLLLILKIVSLNL
jgi:hypothetical protein